MNAIPKTIRSLFVSHGAPTFALEPGLAGPALRRLGEALPRPEAVLVVSPHWMTATVEVGAHPQPQTIHDFGGFPEAMYQLQYPAPGHPALAGETVEHLRAAGWDARVNQERGLDHGAWVPLMHLLPDASVPVFQVSLPANLTSDRAWALGGSLSPMIDKGVLIVGSGSLTHNLSEVRWRDASGDAYARAFSDWVREAVTTGDHDRLKRTLTDAPHARRAHPTTEHFLPLLVAAGAAGNASPASVIEGGIEHGVLSMDGFVFGRTRQTAAAGGLAS
ncbi:MAG: class III extradiol ring-cleavage dioxygenase [Pseudomonadota bacterium]|nr:class III extradiol ring-cleavage dioxygenase [Pseudomonadota bacterium]